MTKSKRRKSSRSTSSQKRAPSTSAKTSSGTTAKKTPSQKTPVAKRPVNKKPLPSNRKKQAAKRSKTWWIIGVVAVVAILVVVMILLLNPGKKDDAAVGSANPNMPVELAARNGMYAEPPSMVIDPAKQYVATIETEKGDIVAELYADKVPNTVNNFVFLAREGFYDNTTFHRVLADFMAQAGDPTGSGSGGPGYRFEDEIDMSLLHDGPGVFSMANSGPNTNGGQFFITLVATPWLDGQHAVFGKVIEGLDVLNAISLRDPQTATEPGDLIKTIRIAEK